MNLYTRCQAPSVCVVCRGVDFTPVRRVTSPVLCDVLRCAQCGLLRREILLKELTGRAKIGRQLYPDYEAIEERVAEARQRLWKNIFPKLASYRRNNRMLDIGSARGHFLAAARNNGWEVEGIEPSVEDSDYARKRLGVSVRAGTFMPGLFSAGAYDVVTLWNVLDHFLDPLEALVEIRKLLRPGGVLALRLPNGTLHLMVHRLSRLMGKRDFTVFHNYAFNRKSLDIIIKKAGFSACRVDNGLPSTGDPYRLFGSLGSWFVDMMKIMAFSLSQGLYYASGRRVLLAPSFIVLAEKGES